MADVLLVVVMDFPKAVSLCPLKALYVQDSCSSVSDGPCWRHCLSSDHRAYFLVKTCCRASPKAGSGFPSWFLSSSLTPRLSSGHFFLGPGVRPDPMASLKSNGLQAELCPTLLCPPPLHQSTLPPPIHPIQHANPPNLPAPKLVSRFRFWLLESKKGSAMPPSFADLRISSRGILNHTTALSEQYLFTKEVTMPCARKGAGSRGQIMF